MRLIVYNFRTSRCMDKRHFGADHEIESRWGKRKLRVTYITCIYIYIYKETNLRVDFYERNFVRFAQRSTARFFDDPFGDRVPTLGSASASYLFFTLGYRTLVSRTDERSSETRLPVSRILSDRERNRLIIIPIIVSALVIGIGNSTIHLGSPTRTQNGVIFLWYLRYVYAQS